MLSICFYFQVHQPRRIRHFRHFDIGQNINYFGDESDNKTNNKKIIQKVASKSYLPANSLLLKLLHAHPELKLSFSLSGIALEQFEEYSPETLKSFQELVKTGRVEILAETYYHSLAFFYSRQEFESQVNLHTQKVNDVFGQTPKVFRNTELAYTNDLGLWADSAGYKAVLAEGWDYVLGWRSPNFVYKPPGAKNIKLLLKNYKLSDDIAFRFSQSSWSGWPLTAEKFSHWVSSLHGNAVVLNLFMDYETFGEHQWEDTGIFNFLEALPGELLNHPDNTFKTPSEIADSIEASGDLDIPHILTWADTERDLSAWSGNDIQKDALNKIFELEDLVLRTKDENLIRDWRTLTTSDHFYYMCTKWWGDGDVHAYFNPYESPYDAFRFFMNTIKDFKLRLKKNYT